MNALIAFIINTKGLYKIIKILRLIALKAFIEY